MTKYISKPENLKLMMNLLRDKSPNIQFEAFHVFKVECDGSNVGICLSLSSGQLPAVYSPLYLRENEIGSLSVLRGTVQILELF